MNKTIHNESPYVCTYDNMLTDEECEHFINISKDNLKRAEVSSDKSGYISSGRTGSNTWITHDHDEITKRVGEKIAKMVNIPLENAEKFQIIHYGQTQEYRNHYDSWKHNGSEKTLRCMKYGGARMATALCYLNDVKKGGGTKMTKLNITISPKKGKLLIFHNTMSLTDNTRHILSEHAGLPVEEGEKYAFNLWFKECKSSKLYSEVNPDYYKDITTPQTNTKPLPMFLNEPSLDNQQLNEKIQLHSNSDIFKFESFINTTYSEYILTRCVFDTNSTRKGAWVKIKNVSNFINRLEKITNIKKEFYENVNIVEYTYNKLQPRHLNAYDLTTEHVKKNCLIKGQRLYTISIPLSNNIKIDFPSLSVDPKLSIGDCLFYKNTLDDTDTRNPKLQRSIINTDKEPGYLANIYIREKDKDGNSLLPKTSRTDKELELIPVEPENYMDTLNSVLEQFKANTITKSWSGLNSFKYLFKGDFNSFKNYIAEYIKIRESTNCLNPEPLNNEYSWNEKLPIQVVNNILNKDLLNLLQKYYRETIDNKVWTLGDRQSNRFKAHNEPMSRFIHYDILPLIEKITNRKLKPTYTYLSAYIKDADLPAHTDRADCEYTVSFIVDKPEGSNWNIYVHKLQQPVKHKGRCEKPPLEECEAVDCNAGGLMLFQGIDRTHFREKLEYDYYNILLLHYCSV